MTNNREIKFRAWDKKENKMQQVVQILYGHEASNYPLSVDFFRSVKSRLIKDIELMQYTGLKDKNGVEIYEGDIIDYLGTFESGDGYRGEIKFDEGVYYFMGKSKIGRKAGVISSYVGLAHEKAYQHCEVIGNIYENSELLTKL